MSGGNVIPGGRGSAPAHRLAGRAGPGHGLRADLPVVLPVRPVCRRRAGPRGNGRESRGAPGIVAVHPGTGCRGTDYLATPRDSTTLRAPAASVCARSWRAPTRTENSRSQAGGWRRDGRLFQRHTVPAMPSSMDILRIGITYGWRRTVATPRYSSRHPRIHGPGSNYPTRIQFNRRDGERCPVERRRQPLD